MRRRFRILSTILSLVLLTTTLSPATVNAADDISEIAIASDLVGERTNVQFLKGTPGDRHLIYTYQQNGNMYKAIENASEDFQNVDCQIFLLNKKGIYVENSIQHVSVDNEGNPRITIESATGDIEQRVIDASSSESSFLESDSVARLSNAEWVTEYYDGRRSNLKGLGISVLISVITGIATYYSSSLLATATVSGVSAVANFLFAQNIDIVYYHAIYNWRYSPKNSFVIDETEWTQFFSDAGHYHTIGSPTYAEYIL